MNLDELYFKDNFTKEENKTNLSINRLEAECITSKNNKFSLDENGNLTVNSINTNNNSNNELYPIGSIYMSVNNVNPSTLFGGSWEQIKDRFLLGCGNDFVNGSTGGEREHTLTINEMPKHSHGVEAGGKGVSGFPTNNIGFASSIAQFTTNGGLSVGEISNNGGSQSHNNMPPYLAVYMWKRVG